MTMAANGQSCMGHCWPSGGRAMSVPVRPDVIDDPFLRAHPKARHFQVQAAQIMGQFGPGLSHAEMFRLLEDGAAGEYHVAGD